MKPSKATPVLPKPNAIRRVTVKAGPTTKKHIDNGHRNIKNPATHAAKLNGC